MIEHARTRYQDKFYFYSNDLFIGQSIKLYGEYTQVEIEYMEKYLNDTSVVYDVGGNIGYHTTAFASIAKEVHTFEPNEKNFALLEMNTEANDNVYLYQCAISNVNQFAHISDYDETVDGNFGKCELGDSGQLCRTFKLDELNIPDPDLIKIDVEGHEMSVFDGAQETITRAKPVIFFESMHVPGLDQIYDFLTGIGYNIYWAHAYNYNARNFNNNEVNVFVNSGVVNCLAVPKDMTQPDYLEPMRSREETSDSYINRMIANGKLQIRQ